MMPEVARAEADELAVLQEFLALVMEARVATMRPRQAERFLKELERRAALLERVTAAVPLRSSPATVRRAARHRAAQLVLAVVPLLAGCVPP